jgi:hypothetical protein
MTEVDYSGSYLNTENVQDGDIVTITGEGEYVPFEYKGVKKTIFNLPVQNGNKEKIFSPNSQAGKSFVKAWGKDSKDWVAKQFQVVIVQDQGKDRILVKPLVQTKI